MRLTYAMLFVQDMDRSVQFYRDAVGIPLKFQSPGWSEFATEGCTLALHMAKPGATAQDEAAGSCRPGFGVPDLDAFHARMVQHGVACVQEPTLLHGSKVAQYRDPDGLVFAVGEERPH